MINNYNDVLNMIIFIFTRKLTKLTLTNKKFDSNFLISTSSICLGFAIYLKITKSLIVNNFTDDKYINNAFESCKKYGTMLIVTNLIKGKLFSKNFIIIFINTIISYILYHLVFERILDDNSINKSNKNIIMGFIESYIFQLIENLENYDDIKLIDYFDLIGRYIYFNLIKKYINF